MQGTNYAASLFTTLFIAIMFKNCGKDRVADGIKISVLAFCFFIDKFLKSLLPLPMVPFNLLVAILDFFILQHTACNPWACRVKVWTDVFLQVLIFLYVFFVLAFCLY